jgi:hypothetical protein
MTKRSQDTDEQGHSLYTDFGAFYPTGHIVVAFEHDDDGRQVCQELRTAGYDQGHCEIHPAEEVAKAAQGNLDNTGFMARWGKSAAAVKKHLQAAQKGATFLLVYAPKDEDAERVMSAISDKPILLAHRYHRLVIEDLREDEADTHMTSPR